VGVDDQALVDKDNEVSITGYPSQQFLKCANIFDAVFERVSLKGRILEIDDSIVYHDLNTSLGHSGSPILAYNIHQEPVILGIHTHKGSTRNSGVFLTPRLLERLIQYEINFALQHDRYKLAIKFPPRLRKSVLEQLDTSHI
jgi:V8-like Glu-specific endopeptidase